MMQNNTINRRSLVLKNAIYALVVVGIMYGYSEWKKSKSENAYKIEINGKAMGTTYQIKYLHSQPADYQTSIDSILDVFNQSLSTYIPESEISRFNAGDSILFQLPYFYPVLKRSEEIYRLTEGAFNPTVMPLVKAWGFGKEKEASPPSQTQLDSLLKLVDFESIRYDTQKAIKTKKGIQLDFNAIAQGYGTDVIVDFLQQKGISNYMVEIGGEVRCGGVNEKGKAWSIGIENPLFEEKGGIQTQAVAYLRNQSLATSGSYRKFFMKDGKRYSHTINPKTGLPTQQSLLSASVFAPDCMTADALATAFMVMGTEKSIEAVKKMKAIDIFLIYDDNGTLKTYTSNPSIFSAQTPSQEQ